MLSEMSDREKQVSYDITQIWNLKEQNKIVNIAKGNTHRYREQTNWLPVGKGEKGDQGKKGVELRGINYYV